MSGRSVQRIIALASFAWLHTPVTMAAQEPVIQTQALLPPAPLGRVHSEVSALSAGQWQYRYVATSAPWACEVDCHWEKSPYLPWHPPYSDIIYFDVLVNDKVMSFAVPYFADAGISNIVSPTGWSYTLTAPNPERDPFGLASKGAGLLTWSATQLTYGLASDASLAGFGFDALYGQTKGPFEFGYQAGYTFLGDPAIPNSPMTDAALNGSTAVSLPAPLGLSAMGLVVLGAMRSGRRVFRLSTPSAPAN